MKCENHLCTPSLQDPGDPNFKHVCLAVSWVHAMELHPFFYTYPSSQLPSKKQRPTPNAFRTQLDGKMMCSLLTVDCTEKRTHKPKLEKSEMLRPSTQWSISSSVKKKHQHKDVSLVKQIQADSVLFCRSSKDFCRSALNLLPAWRADSLWPFKSFNCLGPMGQNPGVECNLSYLVVSRIHPDLLAFGHHPASSRQHRVQLHRLKSPQRSQERWSMSCTDSNYHSCW